MNKIFYFLSVLALIFAPVQSGTGVQETHNFDSGPLQPVFETEVVVPGARPGLQSVTFVFDFDERFMGQYNAAPFSAPQVTFTFNPAVDIFAGNGITSTLDQYFTAHSFAPSEVFNYDSGVLTKSTTFTLADQATLNQFIGKEAVLPLRFRGGYTMFSTGAGRSKVQSEYAWSGSIIYNY